MVKWKNKLLIYLKSWTHMRIVLSIPRATYEAILKLKLLPEDEPVQVFRDAFETHNQVVHAIRSGGKIFIHHGATIIPLNLEHLTTPEVRRASFEVIKGDRDD